MVCNIYAGINLPTREDVEQVVRALGPSWRPGVACGW